MLKLEPDNILISKTFKTEFNNLNPELKNKIIPQSFSKDFSSDIKKINDKLSNVEFNIKTIKPKHSSFNQIDFL